MLNCRIEKGVDPVRIICDTELKIPLDSNIVKTAKEIKTIVAYSKGNEEKIQELEKQNITVLKMPYNNGIDLKALMEALGEMKIDSVLIEGGGKINSYAIEAGIVNKVYAYIAPKIVGGKEALSPITGEGIEYMKDAVELENLKVEQIDRDYLLTRIHKEALMFTGIIEELGKIKSIENGKLSIECKKVLERKQCRRQHSSKWNMPYCNKYKRWKLRYRYYARNRKVAKMTTE